MAGVESPKSLIEQVNVYLRVDFEDAIKINMIGRKCLGSKLLMVTIVRIQASSTSIRPTDNFFHDYIYSDCYKSQNVLVMKIVIFIIPLKGFIISK